ncbi:glycoside hydrolase 43 family protein [candidate division KSB1 bacterium]|nr:glycoside hydrolase 43 family protein [candidate division KSB1 bacterium]
MRPFRFFFLTIALFTHILFAQTWVPDIGNGRYKNPVIFADYSDPDVIRVDDSFYMVASSFNCMPGIPVLQSNDLVNWQIFGHVYQRLPLEKYNKPVHGEGSWAPSIRFHDGTFYVYFCTPHDGLFVATAQNPAGPWELEHIVKVELWEDPCPFWDDDGNAYLVRSKLRADILYLHRMSKDGKQILDNGEIIYHNIDKQPTIEGPKLLKKDGTYYILAPAGGVPKGWQTALRSKNIYGPYEDRIVLHTGNTDINGPHQGGLVELKSGEWWFTHFQDRGVYGRIVHLQPVTWKDGWPEMGEDINSDGIGEPVAEWQKPDVGRTFPVSVPQTSDEFETGNPGLQWQWHANPENSWFSLTENPGKLRLFTVKNITQNGNFWFVPNLLLQKFPAPFFTVTAQITFFPEKDDDKSGLFIMGRKWAYLAMVKVSDGLQIGMYTGSYFQGSDQTQLVEVVDIQQNTCLLKVIVDEEAACTFSYSTDGENYLEIGEKFPAVPGVWIGAKVGLFCINPNMAESRGYADFDWFRFE